jgi:GNAT superfamily N-acetyltransferase
MLSETIEIRPFDPADAEAISEAEAISAMILQVFDEHVAPTFEPEGVAEFHDFINADMLIERAKVNITFVAWQHMLSGVESRRRVVGIIDVKETDHVSLLFVRTSHMGLGIATALVARAVEACRAAGRSKMTVNSSLNAQTFYEHMGFEAVAEPQQTHGFSYVPMEKLL